MTTTADRQAAARALRQWAASDTLPPLQVAYVSGFAAALDVSCARPSELPREVARLLGDDSGTIQAA